VGRNSDETGSSRRTRWPGTSGLRSDVLVVRLEVVGRPGGAIAMLHGRRDRTGHTPTRFVHARDSSVDELGTRVGGEAAINPRLAPARSQCGVPEAKAAISQCADLAYRQSQRAGERKA
jgi:hypothetical protein